jgi:hypothetical protein
MANQQYIHLIKKKQRNNEHFEETHDGMRLLSMKWGTMCEKHAVATYLQNHLKNQPGLIFHETGIWFISEWLASSPDGIVTNNNETYVIEIKCPYKRGQPECFDTVPFYYIPQVQLQMKATETMKCHLVCWSPKETKIFEVNRNENYITELVSYLEEFSKNIDKNINIWDMNNTVRLNLKKK